MSFEKTLRGGNGSTTPGRAFNTRYGSVSSGSKGPMDADEFESPMSRPNAAGPSPSPASVGKNPTPRQGGRYVTATSNTIAFGSSGKATSKHKSGLAAASRLPVRQNSTVDTDADSVSVAESDDVSVMTEDDYGPQEGDSVQVFVRVRPINAAEIAEENGYPCTRMWGDRGLALDLKHRSEPYNFKFDAVLPETTTQEEVFERAGKPIVDNCMGGYNSSIFAYGQTGAGKTYTMQGPLSAALQDDNPQRGMAPRVFQYLFTEIDKAQDENCHENLTFCCKCSMLEIYNEVVTDLINPAGTNLQIREDIKRGCYVEDLSEHTVQNVSDAMALMRKGAENRHTGETRLNRESSRSHSVFTCVLERQSKNQTTGITNVLFSRLNLIDLAGSERVHGGEHGGSQAAGKHFKEACHINKSLTTLGRVITELVEAQRTTQGRGGTSVGKGIPANRARHVPYRDSRLTFLLQDSLGGNAKTLMIANISPSSVSGNETLSTLQFMSRAKCIRNRAKINLDAQGDVQVLQKEIARLNSELDNLRKGYTEPAIQENKQLREELGKLRDSRGETQIRLVNLEKENQNLKSERRRLDNKLAQVQKGSNQLGAAMFTLGIKMESYEAERDREMQRVLEIGQLERQLLQAELEAAHRESQGAGELQEAVVELQQQLHNAHMAADSSARAAEAASAKLAALRVQLEAEQQQKGALAEEASTAQQQASDLAAQLAEFEQQAASLGEQLQAAQQDCSQLTEQLSSAVQESASVSRDLEVAQQQAVHVQEKLETTEQQVADLELQLNSTRQESAALCEQLSASQGEVSSLQAQVASVQQETLDLAAQLAASQQGAAELQQQLAAAQTVSADLTGQLEASRQQHADVTQQLAAAQDDAAAVAKKTQEEHEAAAARQSELSASLEASAAQVQALQQELQDSRAEAQGLKQDGDDVRQQLKQQQQKAAQTRQQLAEVQEQLAATQRDLEQFKEMATCSEAESGKRLADALAAADEAQQAVQQQHSLNAGLQEQLQALHQQLAQTKQELQQEAQARQQEFGAAASSQAAADAIEQQLREQLEALQQLLATKQEDLGNLDSEKQELHSKLGLKQQQCSELQQQLEAEQGRSAEGRSQVAALEEAVAELNTLVKDRSTALDAAQEQIRQLQLVQHQKEDALASAAAKHEQLSSDLAALREGSKGKQDELMKQVTEVHMQLSAAQQEQERLQEELDGLRNDNSALQSQLADAQGETDNFRGQASSKGLEVELLRKKLAAADSNTAALRADLQEAQEEASELRQQMQAMEAEAGESQAAADEQLNDVKRALLDKDQLLQEYEYEKSQMQRRMEELGQRLADKSSSLEGSRSEVQALKAQIRDQSAAARRQEAALAEQNAHTRQLQAENASMAARLQDVSEQLAAREDELRGRLNMNELQLKEQIVYNARNRQAMNEIRKVINWAQQLPAAATPPHGSTVSRPGSSASRRAGLLPMGHLEAGSIPGSPASSHYGELLPAEPHSDAPEQGEEAPRGAATTLLLPSSSGRHHSSHLGHGHSRHQHHSGDSLMVTPGSDGCLMAGRAGSNSGSSTSSRRVGKGANGGSSPSKMQLASRAGNMMPLMLQVSGDLHVDAAGEGSAASGYQERDTAGGAGPDSPTVPEAAVCLALAGRSRGIGSNRMGSPTRSSGSKQQLAAALAAAQHKLLPDQQHHHAKPQERYAAEAEDDTLPTPGPEDSFECQEEHTYCDGRSGAAGDGRHLMAPQRASSPVASSPTKELQHGSTGRNRSSRRGLRAGSDTHSFSSMGGKQRHHKMTPGEAHPVVLSVSGEWSAGGHDSIPDMRLPAAIVGDDAQQA